ncbi:hypothetical protein EYF80_013428 [Liparis tanakae]|uniref:Uncharacterized protein n=1 Tax=Liparis tanakae TaxID=230148 RepID=A0A4Z2IE36_9TELE|nr:hypothetical protein EYF80_013428 [Liparis tanakae]
MKEHRAGAMVGCCCGGRMRPPSSLKPCTWARVCSVGNQLMAIANHMSGWDTKKTLAFIGRRLRLLVTAADLRDCARGTGQKKGVFEGLPGLAGPPERLGVFGEVKDDGEEGGSVALERGGGGGGRQGQRFKARAKEAERKKNI